MSKNVSAQPGFRLREIMLVNLKKIISYTKSKFGASCINGTAALQVSLRLLGLKADHEVIVPTITFIAPINAIKYFSANLFLWM